jgi:hypothetical protein
MKVERGGPLPPELLEELRGPFAFTLRRSTKPSVESQPSEDEEPGNASGQPEGLSPTLTDTATRLGLSLRKPTVQFLWQQLAGKDNKTPDEVLFLKELELAMTPAQRNSLLW